MDFLGKAYAQLGDLLRSMTPAARVTAGLLLVVIVVSLGYLVKTGVSSADGYLFGGQSFAASDLPGMEAAFAKAGLNDYELEGTRIRIPRGQQAVYVAALADGNALPPDIADVIEEPQRGGSIFESEKQRQQRILTAKQRALSLILSSMKGIDTALVMYDVQPSTGLNRKSLATASVSVKPEGNQGLEEERVPAIRHLVAGAVAGLPPESVAVTDLNSGRFYPAGDAGSDGSGGMGGDAYIERKRRYEKEWAEKIREALHFVPGVVVTTDVLLDTEIDHEEKSTDLDPKSVPVEIMESTTTSDSQAAVPNGRPGLAAQGGVNTQAAVGRSEGSRNESETSETHQRVAVGSKTIEKRRHGLTPLRVTASVGVPSSYFERIWTERNPAAPGEEVKKPSPQELEAIEADATKKIQDYVMQMIPAQIGVGADGTPAVRVTTFQHITPPTIAGPTTTDNALAWLGQYWTTLGMSLLGLVSLVMLRSMVRSAPAADLAPAVAGNRAADTQPAEDPEESDAAPSQRKLKRRNPAEPTLRDELVEIVREDPDAAANILRTWIGNAS